MKRTPPVLTAMTAMASMAAMGLAGALAPAQATTPAHLGAAAQAAETCFGQPATITNADLDADGRITGTEGDDVILAEDVTNVTALGGGDTLCVSGVGWVDAGGGNDRVDAGTPGRGWVVLGSGSDVFEGSPARDRVQADEFDGEDSYPGERLDDTDVVRTYGGGDSVFLADSSDSPAWTG